MYIETLDTDDTVLSLLNVIMWRHTDRYFPVLSQAFDTDIITRWDQTKNVQSIDKSNSVRVTRFLVI